MTSYFSALTTVAQQKQRTLAGVVAVNAACGSRSFSGFISAALRCPTGGRYLRESVDVSLACTPLFLVTSRPSYIRRIVRA